MICKYSHKAVDQGDSPLMLLCGLWKSTEALWQNELQMWVFWARDTHTQCEREGERGGWLIKSLQTAGILSVLSFPSGSKRSSGTLKQLRFSYHENLVWLWNCFNVCPYIAFPFVFISWPNEVTELLWRQGLYRGVLLAACATAGGRQKHRDVSSPLR